MNTIQKIISQKKQITEELYEWAETFIGEKDEEGEETSEPYETVFSLAKRLEDNNCDKEDYKNIEFHIYQINYNEEKISL